MGKLVANSLACWARLIVLPTASITNIIPRSTNLSTTCSSPFSFPITASMSSDPQLEAIFERKRSLRSQIRKRLRSMSPGQRSEEDNLIQGIVLEAPWFNSSRSLSAYMSCDALLEVDTSRIVSQLLSKDKKEYCRENPSKRLYLPWIEDKNSNMKMIQVGSYDELVPNSMNILEPSPIDPSGRPREDAMVADEPIDLFILPGLAFDITGRRLGRSGGYYDTYLKKYQELATERRWKQPLLVALAYSTQIVEEGAIAVTSNDLPVDVIVSPAGVSSTNSSRRMEA